MVLLNFFLVLSLHLCTVVKTVAPGDEEPLCEQLRAVGAAPTPAYSTNMRVLMDSWNYQNLLPTRTGAVWDQVDNDMNNDPSLTTNWIQQSNAACQQSVQVCGFSAGLQDNWLITQLINRTVNGTRIPQVSVMIEFSLQNCDVALNCQRTFSTHIYETSTENGTAARNVNNYQQVRRVSPDVTTGARVNETITINFSTDHSSFYFAIQDETTCITVTRLIVFYHFCPQQTADLIIYPETFVPAEGQLGILVVTASCVANAEPENGDVSRVICLREGVWNPIPNAGCRCSAGFSLSNETCEQTTATTTMNSESTAATMFNSETIPATTLSSETTATTTMNSDPTTETSLAMMLNSETTVAMTGMNSATLSTGVLAATITVPSVFALIFLVA